MHHRRARFLAEAERAPEGAMGFAALTEGNSLGRYGDAVARLAAGVGGCRESGPEEATHVLEARRQECRSHTS